MRSAWVFFRRWENYLGLFLVLAGGCCLALFFFGAGRLFLQSQPRSI